MIRFYCRCGHVFEESDDAAGTDLQCPRCMLLNDVPLLSELQGIAGDGTYKVGDGLVTPNPEAMNDLIQAFAKSKVDSDGNPIDLRNSADEMRDVGAYETLEGAQRRQRPRYDPETGERLEPIPLAQTGQDLRPVEIPFAIPVVGYAPVGMPRGHVLLELCKPLNLFVMFFVLCICVVGGLADAIIAARLYFFIPVLIAIAIMILAHYGNVVNEIGIENRDELPRILGDMRMHDDVWLPATAVTTSLVLCYGPSAAGFFLLPLSTAVAAALAAVLALFGTLLAPAITLTLLSSGSIANLRPDRVLAVIQRNKKRYLGIVLLLLIGLLASAAALFCVTIESMRLAIPVLVVSIFVLHYFCWHLGLYYRAYNEHFPWVGRVHERTPRPPVVRRKPRYVETQD